MITFKALAALLAYPEAELLAALPEIGGAIDSEGLLPLRERSALASFLAELKDGAIGDIAHMNAFALFKFHGLLSI